MPGDHGPQPDEQHLAGLDRAPRFEPFHYADNQGVWQLTAKHKVATPANWKQGEDVIISGAVSNDEAKQKYPGGWKAPKPYLRIVPQPK